MFCSIIESSPSLAGFLEGHWGSFLFLASGAVVMTGLIAAAIATLYDRWLVRRCLVAVVCALAVWGVMFTGRACVAASMMLTEP